MFCPNLFSLLLFGNTLTPLWTPHASTTCPGVTPREDAISVITGSLRMGELYCPSGLNPTISARTDNGTRLVANL